MRDFVCWCDSNIAMFLFMKMIIDVSSEYQICMALKYRNLIRYIEKNGLGNLW